jgi:hypothetical protein
VKTSHIEQLDPAEAIEALELMAAGPSEPELKDMLEAVTVTLQALPSSLEGGRLLRAKGVLSACLNAKTSYVSGLTGA